MEERVNRTQSNFKNYFESFSGLSQEHQNNFVIKYDHSLRVADLCKTLAKKIGRSEDEQTLAFCAGLFHDIGRFAQLVEFNTFNDSKSVDHAEYSVKVLRENDFLSDISEQQQTDVLAAIFSHNKREISRDVTGDGLELAKLLRDADKLDILKVITDNYTKPRSVPNHTLTWEMPVGSVVTPAVAKQVLAGDLVDKASVASQLDIKVMQLSWVYDLNFKPSFQFLMESRFMEKIYATLPKSDTVIQIFRSVKVYAENKVMN
ncbi:HD domain-containing protein [Maribellus mangrovi]|uniref:HD domain-containing protein n=1 Tax=Maribellus mangrovi TaxID=3133146 RepID=UPI0030EF5318